MMGQKSPGFQKGNRCQLRNLGLIKSIFLLLAFFLLPWTVLSKEGASPGSIAPNFSLPDTDGQTVSINDLYEKGPVWLTLFTTWCPGCDVEAPLLAAASKKYPSIQFVAVDLMEKPSVVSQFKKKYEISYPILLDKDGGIVDEYQARSIPVNLGIAKGGEILFRRQQIEEFEEIKVLSEALLEEQGLSSQRSQPISARFLGSKKVFGNFPLAASFLAGILTFLSPCILPLIPAYLSMIAGFGLTQLLSEKGFTEGRKALLLNTCAFIFGFGFIFTLLGATASVAGQRLLYYQSGIRLSGGILLIIFGLHISGAWRLLPLYREIKFRMSAMPSGPLGDFVMVIIFAVGWTPCVGPILSAILLYSASEATLYQGILMLGAYSAGIGFLFLMASIFILSFQNFIAKIKPYFQIIEISSGALVIALGILLITNRFAYLAGYLPGK